MGVRRAPGPEGMVAKEPEPLRGPRPGGAVLERVRQLPVIFPRPVPKASGTVGGGAGRPQLLEVPRTNGAVQEFKERVIGADRLGYLLSPTVKVVCQVTQLAGVRVLSKASKGSRDVYPSVVGLFAFRRRGELHHALVRIVHLHLLS